MTFSAIVVAAGSGTRFGGPKHSALLAGIPLWQHGRSLMLECGADTVVVVGDVEGGVPGGPRRSDSVAAGLEALPGGPEFVLIHDAARPLASPSLVKAVIKRLEEGGVDGVVPAIAVTDTVKSIDETGRLSTVDRSRLLAVQTPQGFKADSLRSAHAAVEVDVTDDAELIERWGGRVVTIEGEPTNLKVTYPTDLAMAAALLDHR